MAAKGDEDDLAAVESDQEETSSPQHESILTRLRPPTASVLSRKRSISKNSGSSKKSSYKPPSQQNAPKTKTPASRVKQFPGEMLSVRNGKLFCDACRHELSLIKIVITNHVQSEKHCSSKADVCEQVKKSKQLLLDGGNYLRANNASGTTLPPEVVAYRLNCLETLMKAGIPVAKLDILRPLLQSQGERLTGSQHISELIPVLHAREIAHVKTAIAGKHISIIFDGTTKVCEAMVIIVRSVDDDFTISQHLARLMLAAKSLTGEQVAHALVHTLATKYQVQPSLLVAAMRDRASVNNVAVRSIQMLYLGMVDVGCFSHTLDHVGGAVKADDLDAFVASWVQLFSHSPKSRLEFYTLTGVSIRSYSRTRWWSKWQVMEQLHDMFGDVKKFLTGNEVDGESHGVVRRRLKATIEDPETRARLQMQLAVAVEFGRPFANATYKLEGDGALCLEAYEVIASLRNFVEAEPMHLPSTAAVAQRLGGLDAQAVHVWMQFGLQCLPDAKRYFQDRFGPGGALHPLVEAFRAARLCNPSKVAEMMPVAADVDDLKAFPFITPADVDQMKEELPQYLAAIEDVHATINPIDWWKAHADQHKAWAHTFRRLLLVQPSSAAAERVFSLLESSFNKRQESALEDYLETSLMLQYNHPKQ